MFKLIKEIFRSGEATVKYPFAPLAMEKDLRGKPEHTGEQCIACAACTIACPANAIGMETDVEAATRTWSIDYGRCVFCGRCEEVCPTDAIRLTEEFELAVANRADLVMKAVFKLARCAVCDTPFAVAKEVAYVQDIVALGAPTADEAEQRRRLAATCPACKRAHDVTQIAAFGVARRNEETRR